MKLQPTVWALAPWYGAKRVLADRIVAEFGQHHAYWEPMCGSLAITLAKPVCRQETVSDLHGDVINLARCLANLTHAEYLYRRLARTLASEDLFHDSVSFLETTKMKDAQDADRAYHFVVACWLGRNGMAGTASYNNHYCLRYSNKGGTQGTRFRAAVESIPAWHQRLRRVSIIRRCAFQLLKFIDDAEGTVIYLDPPYLVKGNKYLHDFCDNMPAGNCYCGSEHSHVALADLLHTYKKARVLVSYYNHVRLDELYPNWTKLSFDVTKSMGAASKKASKANLVKAPEVLLINGPSFGNYKEPWSKEEEATTLYKD